MGIYLRNNELNNMFYQLNHHQQQLIWPIDWFPLKQTIFFKKPKINFYCFNICQTHIYYLYIIIILKVIFLFVMKKKKKSLKIIIVCVRWIANFFIFWVGFFVLQNSANQMTSLQSPRESSSRNNVLSYLWNFLPGGSTSDKNNTDVNGGFWKTKF